ncbi:phthiocerol/phthiodiolone dimycocerosyl transferase family protein [Tsukamurella soli]|uniref:phthiocerol/phthiodiolone dimycocerosyl transferase family protein n=1 Tax=Tsukamurella soli TaxID=644556 RepID=UPI0036082E10
MTDETMTDETTIDETTIDEIRPVAPSEAGFLSPAPTTCAYESTLVGRLDVDALATSFAALRWHHPALDASARPGDAGWVFVSADRGDDGVCASGAPFTVETVAELPEPAPAPVVDPSRSLAALSVVTSGDRHRVTLAFNHAAADAGTVIGLFDELWSGYAQALATGSVADLPPVEFPRSAEGLIAARGIRVGTDSGRERVEGVRWYGAMPVGTSTGPCLPDVTSLRFSPEVTARFARAAEDHGMSALLSGVLLSAERAGFVDEPADLPIRVGALTLVDMRRRLGEPVDPTSVTNLVAASFAAVDLTTAPTSDPAAAVAAAIAVGAEVAGNIRPDLQAGRCLAAMVGPTEPGPAVQEAAEQTPIAPAEPAITLSNLGILHIDLPDGLVYEDLRPRMTLDSAFLHIPPTPACPGCPPRSPPSTRRSRWPGGSPWRR